MCQTQIELDHCIIWPILSTSMHKDTWLLCLWWLFTCIDLRLTFIMGENASIHEMGFCYINCRLSLRCLVSERMVIYHPGREWYILWVLPEELSALSMFGTQKIDSVYPKILQIGMCPLGVPFLWRLCGHMPQLFLLMTRKSWGGSSLIILAVFIHWVGFWVKIRELVTKEIFHVLEEEKLT